MSFRCRGRPSRYRPCTHASLLIELDGLLGLNGFDDVLLVGLERAVEEDLTLLVLSGLTGVLWDVGVDVEKEQYTSP